MSEPGSSEITHKNLAKVLRQREWQRTAELKKENLQLEEISLTDALTGVGNYRAQERFLNEDENRQSNKHSFERRHTGSLYPAYGIILYMDADGLKEANSVSRQNGNDLLKIVAQSAKETAQRPNDLVFRQGGDGADEFSVILPGDTPDLMEDIVRKFNNALERISGDKKITASLAIGKYGFGKTARQTIDELDNALSEAKKKRQERGAHVETIYIKDNV